MHIQETFIKGVYSIETSIYSDPRGSFVKTFHKKTFEDMGLLASFEESFYSHSYKNVIRGMHFQIPPKDHAKLVYVSQGSICDVVLDIRKDSETFGKHFSMEISGKNGKLMYIPSGCAHGFLTLSDTACVHYLQSTMHSPDHDSGIRWDSFGMEWGVSDPIMSDRDKSFLAFDNFVSPF